MPLGRFFTGSTVISQVRSLVFVYDSSCNCCGRYLEEPALKTNRADYDRFHKRIHESDILHWAITQKPNPDWVCVLVTQVTFFVNRILQHPIGLYRENAIAVRVIDRSAYDATSSVHAHRQRKNVSYLRNGCCIYYLRPSGAAHL